MTAGSERPFDLPFSRRFFLGLLGGGVAYMAGAPPVLAGEKRIGELIGQAQSKGTISQRIDFISGVLRGTRYKGFTLVGGPRRPEVFVIRDDAFDCVTFCETVLAAAIAGNRSEFDSVLRTIRYHNGVVAWRERNHYFFEWCRHNVENGICRDVTMDGSLRIERTVDTQKGLEKRRFSMRVIPSAVFLANTGKLENGDIVGFVTRRPNLDYFHVGFVAFDSGRELLLRHASLSRHRVLDERMDHFVAVNRVRYVTLLRPQEPRAVA
jgi:N-acetylmuramoyl-L-alanine amidase-like protein